MHKRVTLVLLQLKQKMKKQNRLRYIVSARNIVFSLSMIGLLLTSLFIPQLNQRIAADTCATITECQAQIAAGQTALADLRKTAVSYRDAIEQLNSQIETLQGAINANIAEQNRLQGEIDKAQAEIDRQRAILAEGVKMMYVDGVPSDVEIMFTSKNLNEYIDKAAYRSTVQKKLQDTMKQIALLQKQLSEQRVQVQSLLKQQETQQSQLVAARTEQANMLAYNQSQQKEFSAQTAANQSKLNELIAAQRRANSTNYAPGSLYFITVPGEVKGHNIAVDDYPYRNAGFSMQLGPCSNSDSWPDAPDRWGYCTRQCVSYTAWAVERSGRTAPKFWGNAKNWVYQAPASWVSKTPKVGDIAISTAGTWGHAMYVEAVRDGEILISQYNAGLDGEYSYKWRSY